MNDIMHTIELEPLNGFDLKVNFLVEDCSPYDLFDDSVDDIKKICQKIDSYDLVWFVAEVVASKNGIKLGTAYLGGNLYESYEKFVEDGDYIEDMKSETMKEAQASIQALCSDCHV